ncbi:NAD(+)/NADH kinase [Chloroflexota bacterium]
MIIAYKKSTDNKSPCLTLNQGNCYTASVLPEIHEQALIKVTALQKIGILYHPLVTATQAKAQEIQDFLKATGVGTWLCSAWEAETVREQLDKTDLILTIGGDGTILRAAQAVFPMSIPITGINMGRLGFLTELSADEALVKLPGLVSGKGWIDQRTMLDITLVKEKGEPQQFHALNDVVMARGSIARVVNITARIDDEHFTTYRADGVIMATATGSTGYALAAGGPILPPHSSDFILVPIAPHLSSAYPLILSAKTTVKLQVGTFHEATMSIDGHVNLPLNDGTGITVKQSPHQTHFLRISPKLQFYSSLEQKLRGKK